MSTHPTSKARRKRQRRKRVYASLREECQLSGVIETVPDGAVRNEVAPTAPDPPFPHLVRAALRLGWDVPDANKPKIVADLLAAFFDRDSDTGLRIRLARLLLLLDRTQWERDRLEQAGKSGPVVLNVNVVTVDSAPGQVNVGQQQVNAVAGR